jgi:hypothetical protein
MLLRRISRNGLIVDLAEKSSALVVALSIIDNGTTILTLQSILAVILVGI